MEPRQTGACVVLVFVRGGIIVLAARYGMATSEEAK